MANTDKMFETFEAATRVPVDYTYAVFAFLAVGLVAYLLVITIKDSWPRYQDQEMSIKDFFMVITRSIILFMFMLVVFSPA